MTAWVFEAAFCPTRQNEIKKQNLIFTRHPKLAETLCWRQCNFVIRLVFKVNRLQYLFEVTEKIFIPFVFCRPGNNVDCKFVRLKKCQECRNGISLTRPEKSLHNLVKSPDSNLHFLVSP
ncbi:MAG: hypothetical protein K2U26_12505, partial [Cyclobacteriaceae bacterium]|nr:hypothetical protein [Cyclobacteriaceae bacterium]